MIDKYEHAKFLISRFDHYYDTINSKGSYYIGLNTFILGGLCAGFLSIENKVSRDLWFWVLLVFGFGLCIMSIIYTIKAISPFVKDNESNDDDPSMIFFGGIATHTLNNFQEKIKLESDDKTKEDMYRQVHCLAKGLSYKFNKLKVVSYLLLIQFIFITIFLIYILINYTKCYTTIIPNV